MSTPYLQTLGNGIKVLSALKPGPKTSPELIAETGIARLNLYRILRTLEAEGLVLRVDENSTYQLGLKVWELGQSAEVGARSHPETRRQVERLRQTWGDTVHVAAYDLGEVIYVYKVDGTTHLRAYTTLGGRAPATAVASGKSLLAFQPQAEIDRVMAEPLVAHTDRSLTTAEQLAAELDEARRTLTAVNRGEWRPGIGGVASPILAARGAPVAAVSISGFADRIVDERLGDRAAQVRDAAKMIALGLAADEDAGRIEELYRPEHEVLTEAGSA